MSNNITVACNISEDVIVGIIDTGIWPESESCNDEGLSPVPQKWKVKCENGPMAQHLALQIATGSSLGLNRLAKDSKL